MNKYKSNNRNSIKQIQVKQQKFNQTNTSQTAEIQSNKYKSNTRNSIEQIQVKQQKFHQTNTSQTAEIL
jgi:hypothetical protein